VLFLGVERSSRKTGGSGSTDYFVSFDEGLMPTRHIVGVESLAS